MSGGEHRLFLLRWTLFSAAMYLASEKLSDCQEQSLELSTNSCMETAENSGFPQSSFCHKTPLQAAEDVWQSLYGC